MTLNARQHALPIRTVLLRRVVLVIESHLAVLVRLAVFSKDHRFRLCLALLFLDRNPDEAAKRQNQDQKYFHEIILATKKHKRQKILLRHAEGWAGVAPLAVFEVEVAAEGTLAVVTGQAGRAACADEMF